MRKVDDNFNERNSKPKWLKIFLICLTIILILLSCFLVLKLTGIWERVNSIEKLKAIVESGGVFSFAIFVILQILQTTILQIPSILVTLAGTLVFGRWTAFILSFISIMIGSLIMFWIGRKAGRKFLVWLAGKDSAEKWIERISQGKYLFVLMMLFPLFPDDILCVVAGVTNMSVSFFLTITVISRLIGIGGTVFLSSGAIIPFAGWGLILWGIIAVIVIILFYLSIKYQKKIDDILKQIFNKKRKKF